MKILFIYTLESLWENDFNFFFTYDCLKTLLLSYNNTKILVYINGFPISRTFRKNDDKSEKKKTKKLYVKVQNLSVSIGYSYQLFLNKWHRMCILISIRTLKLKIWVFEIKIVHVN